jgi:hypothetical protein
MKSVFDIIGAELQWTQPSLMKQEFELHANGELAARLRFRSAFGSFATAESKDGCWTFKRVKFWDTRVSVRECGAEPDIAFFYPKVWTGGGALPLDEQRKLLIRTNFWQTDYRVTTETEETLIHFKIPNLIRPSAHVEIMPAAVDYPELTWLAPLSWYLWVLSYVESLGPVGMVITHSE